MDKRLLSMLRCPRPAYSKADERFIETYIDSLPCSVEEDEVGNRIVRVAGADEHIAWSCHTDTMHHMERKQRIVCSEDGMVSLRSGGTPRNSPTAHNPRIPRKSPHNCLGADDTVGVWLMLEMIEAGRSGLYLFHRGEEVGGVGSEFIADETPGVLDGIEAVIALDRAGYDSIITHQFGGRCASEGFSQSLARAFHDCSGLRFAADPTGSFTDTANYTELVGECTNLSVGYFNQHTKRETTDLDFAMRLRDALLEIDLSNLRFDRLAGEADDTEYASMWERWYGLDEQEPLYRR